MSATESSFVHRSQYADRPLTLLGLFLLLSVVGITCFAVLDRHADEWDSAASLQVLGDSRWFVLAFRAACFACVVATLGVMLADPLPFVFRYGRSTVSMTGVSRFSTFTTWAFSLLGLYFG